MSIRVPRPTYGGSVRRRAAARPVAIILCGAAVAAVAAVLLVGVPKVREAASETQCQGRLKQLGYALLNFRDTYGCYPPAHLTDDNGKPMHSWRVLVLPFIEQHKVFDRYDFSEPWDGPNNSKLANMLDPPGIKTFRCSSDVQARSTWTSYVAVVGPGTLWPEGEPTGQTSPLTNNILLVEVANSGIHWMEPRDLTVHQAVTGLDPEVSLGPSSAHPKGINYVTGRDELGRLARPLDGQVVKDLVMVDAAQAAAEVPWGDPDFLRVHQYLMCATSRVPYFRRRAEKLLGGLQQEVKASTPHLLEALKDDNPSVRQAAAEALKRIDAKREVK